MTDIIRWDPFREMMSLREAVDRLFEDAFFWPRSNGWSLTTTGVQSVPVDVYETDKELVVKASVPGLDPKDIEITITDDVLTIKGEVKEEKKVERENYHLRERRYGTFQRSIRLPVGVNADKAEATFENGVLTLTLPKVEEAQAKRIKVKAK